VGAKAVLLPLAGEPPDGALMGYPRSDVERSRALVEAAFPGRQVIGETETKGRWERDGVDPEKVLLSKFVFADTQARQDAVHGLARRMIRVQPE
jgi:hypothetical protein